MSDPIVIVDYDPGWPQMFESERARLLIAFGTANVSIVHIGSTAVPGLAAKPIIDMMAGVSSLSAFDDCTRALTLVGYIYDPYPQFPERRFFRDGPMGAGPHHLHLTEFESDFWRDKVLFRDWLSTHPNDAQDYLALNKALAEKFGDDREKYKLYTVGKSAFIQSMLAKAQAR